MKKLVLAIAASLLVSTPFAVMADGASIAKEKCAACHGEDGNSTDGKVPSIAGLSVDGMTDMMSQYKAGDRTGDKYTPEGGEETDMNAVTKDLSDDDLKAVVEYYVGQEFKPADQEADAELAKAGEKVHKKSCEKCHSEGGASSEDDTGILAGQWKPYLTEQFKEFKEGERDMPKKMAKKFKKLSDDDIKALIEYYASQK